MKIYQLMIRHPRSMPRFFALGLGVQAENIQSAARTLLSEIPEEERDASYQVEGETLVFHYQDAVTSALQKKFVAALPEGETTEKDEVGMFFFTFKYLSDTVLVLSEMLCISAPATVTARRH